MNNAEKDVFLNFSISSYRDKHLCVTHKVTLTINLSFDFSSFLSHSPLFPHLLLWSPFKTIHISSSHLHRLSICESQMKTVTRERICYTEQVKCIFHNNPLNFVWINCDTYHQYILTLWDSWIALKYLIKYIDPL